MKSSFKTIIILSLVIWAFGSLAPLSAEAANLCRSFFETNVDQPTIELRHSSPIKSEGYRDVIQSIDSLLSNLNRPTGLHIIITEPGLSAGYTMLEVPTITLASSYGNGLKSNHPKFSLAILSHEYGHAVLDKNMNAISSIWENTTMQINSITRLAILSRHHFYESMELLNNANTPEEATQAQETVKLAKIKFVEINSIGERLALMKEVQRAYDELFADSTAVVQFQDPRIIFDAMSTDRTQSTKNSKEYLRRNYDSRRFDESWGESHLKQWEIDMSISIKSKFIDPYLLFAPARAALWDYAKLKIKNPKDQKRILSDLLFIIKNHFEANFSHLESVDQIHPRELNLSLIQMFREKWELL